GLGVRLSLPRGARGAHGPGSHRRSARFLRAARWLRGFPALQHGRGSSRCGPRRRGASRGMSATVEVPLARIPRGGEAHKAPCCRSLLDLFALYKPAIIAWPVPDAEARDRLVSLPIWDIAVQTEGRARLNVASYAAVTRDALLREAIELNAFEEGRHKTV